MYATSFGPVHVISTCVEQNPVCKSRDCSLYASANGADWKRILVHRKDRYNLKYFQFGLLVLPYAYNNEPKGIYSGQAVECVDDVARFLEFPELDGI